MPPRATEGDLSTDDESAPINPDDRGRCSQWVRLDEGEPSDESDARSWRTLLCVLAAMVAIGHVQYTWTLFVASYVEALGTTSTAVQFGFSVFVIFQTCSVLAIGLALDRAWLRVVMIVGSVLVGLGLGGLSIAATVPTLYVSCALAGVGVGSVYNGCIASAVGIFPARRGLVAGVVAAGYGSGSFFTVGPVQTMVAAQGLSLIHI